VLRRFTLADVDNLVSLNADPDVMRFLTGGMPTGRDEIENELLPVFLGYYERSDGYGFWAAIEKPPRAKTQIRSGLCPLVSLPLSAASTPAAATAPSLMTGNNGQLHAAFAGCVPLPALRWQCVSAAWETGPAAGPSD
jgi:hypothetical protein